MEIEPLFTTYDNTNTEINDNNNNYKKTKKFGKSAKKFI